MPRRKGRGRPVYRPPVVPYKHPVEPYHPSMKRYSGRSIDAFIESCYEWDDFDYKIYDLPSGELVCIHKYTKYFDNDKNHYIRMEKRWCDNILVDVFHSLLNKNGYKGGGGERSKHPRAAKLSEKVGAHEWDDRVIQQMQPNLDKFFSQHFSFDSVICDPLFTVTVTDKVSFGDFKECQATPSGKEFVAANGIVYKRWGLLRPFLPGVYKVTAIKMFETSESMAIYHHESVDPVKIAKQIVLHINDLSDFHQFIPNSINRYDWCEWKNYGEYGSDEEDNEDESLVEEVIHISDLNFPDYFDHRQGCHAVTRSANSPRENGSSVSSEKEDTLDENSNIRAKEPEFKYLTEHRETIYFVPTENCAQIDSCVKSSNVLKSDVIPGLYHILGNNDEAIAIGVDMEKHKCGEWVYGEMFQDKTSDLNFALVAHGCGPDDMFWCGKMPQRLKDKYPEHEFMNVKDTHMRFDVSEFLLE